MVQTFGKRILGGIGAPGGGMSKAYAEGVNTGIAQRMNRQSMAAVEQDMQLAAQDQQFKIEDREEAKRQRAAAAANAAAAKARSAALARALAGTVGQAPGVKIPLQQNFGDKISVGGSISALPPAGAPLPRTPRAAVDAAPTRTSAAATPATDRRTAGLRTPDMNISNIVDVQGTYDRPSTLPQRRAAAAANVRAGVQTGLPPEAMTAPVLSNMAARPGNFAAQATYGTPDPRAYNPDLGAMVLRAQADLAAAELAFKDMPTGFMSEQVVAAQARLNELEDQLTTSQAVLDYAQRPLVTTRGITAEEGPGSTAAAIAELGTFSGPPVAPGAAPGIAPTVTIKGPNGDIVVPAGTPEEPAPGAASDRGRMPYGRRLGAPSADADASIVDRVAANPPDQPMSPPNTELFIMEPGRNGRELQQSYNEREELVRQIGIYSEYGEYGEVAKLVEQVKTIDNNLYLLQGMQGIQELQFNSPQRLQMVLSEQLGRNIGLQPNDIGGYDVFVDGQRAMQLEAGNGENSLAYWARSLIDSKFAEAEAARAAAYNEKLIDSQFTQANDRARIAAQLAADEGKALLTAQLNERTQVLLADLAVAQDYGTKENELKIKQLQQQLEDNGSLRPDADVSVERADGIMTIYDKNTRELLMQFILDDVIDETGNVVGQKFVMVKE